MNKQRQQQGTTIIELMFAVLIATTLLLGITTTYLNFKSTFTITEAQSTMQENGRFALDFMARDLRKAGSMGCLSDTAWFIKRIGKTAPIGSIRVLVNDPNNYVRQVAQNGRVHGVQVFQANDPNIPAEFQLLDPTPKANTDLVIVRGEVGSVGALTADFPGGAADLEVTTQVFSQNDVVMLTDCREAHVFQITNINPGSGILQHGVSGGTLNNSTDQIEAGDPLSGDIKPYRYDQGTLVAQISTIIYYVADNLNGEPGLYRSIDGRPPQEVASFIESMKILVGEAVVPFPPPAPTVLTANRYVRIENTVGVPNMNIPDNGNITSLEIALLVRSPDPYHDNARGRDYQLFNQTLTFNDRLKRQVYRSRVVIRSRILR